jgi:hypothetical protein
VSKCKRNRRTNPGAWKNQPLYHLWRDIHRRCRAPSNSSYRHYGGRGIVVRDEWRHYPAFREWALESGYQSDLQIDRIDVNGPYSPSNCRWVTNLENQNNKRNNTYVTAFGVTKTLAEWGRDERCVVSHDTLGQRLCMNRLSGVPWLPEKAITTPSRLTRR